MSNHAKTQRTHSHHNGHHADKTWNHYVRFNGLFYRANASKCCPNYSYKEIDRENKKVFAIAALLRKMEYSIESESNRTNTLHTLQTHSFDTNFHWWWSHKYKIIKQWLKIIYKYLQAFHWLYILKSIFSINMILWIFQASPQNLDGTIEHFNEWMSGEERERKK